MGTVHIYAHKKVHICAPMQGVNGNRSVTQKLFDNTIVPYGNKIKLVNIIGSYMLDLV